MKAVIVDLRGGQAAALCDDGRVIKLADPGYSLGQIVELHERRRRTPRWVRWASTAAAAALLLAGAGGGAAWAMPYGVVSLDVNPSLEYTINRFDYVLKVEGVNEDGKEMLSRMDTKQLLYRSIGEALEASVQQLEDGEWLGGESDEILISAGTKQPSHAEKLVQALEDGLCSRRENFEIHGVIVSQADIDAAHRAGMSSGRARAKTLLSTNGPTAPSATSFIASRTARRARPKSRSRPAGRSSVSAGSSRSLCREMPGTTAAQSRLIPTAAASAVWAEAAARAAPAGPVRAAGPVVLLLAAPAGPVVRGDEFGLKVFKRMYI